MATTRNIPSEVKNGTTLETYSIAWLDSNVNMTDDCRYTQMRLRSIINHLIIFPDINQCRQYIKSCTEQDRIVLIVSGRLSKELIPEVHNLRQVSSIYIFCMDETLYEKWAKAYSKIKAVIVHRDDLINRIKTDQKQRVKLEEPMSMNIYNAKNDGDKTTSELKGHFLHSLLLIDVLIRTKYDENDKKKMVQFCKAEHHGNDSQLAIISEFERYYTPERALWWYTRDGFLYSMLNKALRIQNTEVLLLFRFVIRDIYQLLKSHQCLQRIQVFRHQYMSMEEITSLQCSIGQYISINSFFSTSAARDIAMRFANRSKEPNDLQKVLFTIDADPKNGTLKPFADIKSVSYFEQESEVLFMVGCTFRLNKVTRHENENFWMIEIQLVGDDAHDLKHVFNQMKRDYGGGDLEVDVKSFADVLQHMGKYDEAEKVYMDLVKQNVHDNEAYISLSYALGKLYKEKFEFNQSLQWFTTSLERKLNTDPNDLLYIAGLYCCIGNIHLERQELNEASKCYKRSRDYFKRANDTHNPMMAALYHGMARIAYSQRNYADALNLFQRSLNLQLQSIPQKHPSLAINLSSIGDVYRNTKQYKLALNNYAEALEIRQTSLPPKHPEIGSSYKSIGLLFETVNNYRQALENYKEAAAIFRYSLSPQHISVVEIEKDIQRINAKLR